MKIQICIPIYKEYDMLKPILRKLLTNKEHQFTPGVYAGVFPDNSRNEAVVESNLCWPPIPEVDYFLFFDTDMNPNVNQVFKLIEYAEREDIDVVGLLYQANADTKKYCVDVDGKGNTTPETKPTGLQEVEWVGFGCALVKRHVFTNLPKPWFEAFWARGTKDGVEVFKHLHEDMMFCQKVKDIGGKVWCDFDTEVYHEKRDLKKLKERLKL